MALPRPFNDKAGLLIVDDDPLIVETLAYILDADFDIVTAASRSEAIERLREPRPSPLALALVDLGLPPLPHRPDEGFALIGELLAHRPDIRIVVLSGQNDEANGRHARTLGATEFVPKPADPAQLRELLLKTLAFGRPTPAEAEGKVCRLIGESLPMQKLRAQLRQFANSPFPVLVEGESGSGKEIIASCCLHDFSNRAAKPYFALNCAAISPTLVEPTLFGYAKGAFTGASGHKSGYFEDAADGTLFLDEIGELPLELQAKLLRVLENGEFQRVGETQTRFSRARIIAATNRDLRREVREGRFRGDLYHRLSVFTISVPPLRDMGADRLLLLDHFRSQYSKQINLQPFQLSPEAEKRWLDYAFPGNVRELRNIVIRLTAKHPGDTVSPGQLEDELDAGDAPTITEAWDIPRIALEDLQSNRDFNLDLTLRRWERAYIEAAQQMSQGNMSQTARMLGLNRTTLYNRLEALGRNRDEPYGQ
ncbi:MAG TPA: sigma-54 dependent transcriptional regulator [Rhodocyclaceae bacterium]